MASLPARAVLVTARAQTHHYDCISRYFAPWIGVNEDPVTGSAHCALAAYWSHTLGKRQLIGYQASTRGGVVHMQMSSSDNPDRVWLLGQAVTVLEGKLLL